MIIKSNRTEMGDEKESEIAKTTDKKLMTKSQNLDEKEAEERYMPRKDSDDRQIKKYLCCFLCMTRSN